jgi:hypothetical protein
MSTTKEDIRRWLNKGKERGATHVIVACDTWDYDDYPIFVMPDEDVKVVFEYLHNKNMQRVMEVYKLDIDWDAQLNSGRAYNF